MLSKSHFDTAIAIIGRRGRVSYRALKLELGIDDEIFETLRSELIDVLGIAEDRGGTMLVRVENAAGDADDRGAPGPGRISGGRRNRLIRPPS